MVARLLASCRRWPTGAGAVLCGLALLLTSFGFEPPSAEAQFLGAPAKRSRSSSTPQQIQRSRTDPNAQMLVTADEIHYDYTNNRVSAVSRVQIHFAGSVLEADQVVYDQNAKRLHAEGNVRFTDADGRVVYANMLDMDDQFRDGFVNSLRLDQPDKTSIAASRAQRTGGNITVFQNGVYTACEPCKEDPRKPPLWQVRAARIIHRSRREDDLLRGCPDRILRRPARVCAVLLHARSDGQAQDRLPHAERASTTACSASAWSRRSTGRWRPTTT